MLVDKYTYRDTILKDIFIIHESDYCGELIWKIEYNWKKIWKIDDFSKNSAKMEQNLKEAQRIYEEIREDLVNWVPVEHRNAKDLRKLSECFALYNISSIPEAIEMINTGKV